jgi:hypothetical protein
LQRNLLSEYNFPVSSQGLVPARFKLTVAQVLNHPQLFVNEKMRASAPEAKIPQQTFASHASGS